MTDLTMYMAGAILLLTMVGAWCVWEIVRLRRRLEMFSEAKPGLLEWLEAEYSEFIKTYTSHRGEK